MIKLIFWVAYAIGFIVSYYLSRWFLKKLDMSLGFFDDSWTNVYCAIFYSIFSWVAFIVILLFGLIYGFFTKKDVHKNRSKPPKWL